jgi:hypothetical protein
VRITKSDYERAKRDRDSVRTVMIGDEFDKEIAELLVGAPDAEPGSTSRSAGILNTARRSRL